jgi:hypothetical protein
LLDRLKAERDHERRAALICVLTAVTTAVGKATPIGDETGGNVDAAEGSMERMGESGVGGN